MSTNEAYAEWLVKRKTPSYAPVAKVGAIVLVAAVALITLPSGGMIGFAAIAAAVAFAYWVFTSSQIEYEYLFVSGVLTIDKITAKSRRKNVAEYNMADLLVAAPMKSDKIKDMERQVKKVEDYSSGQEGTDKYVLIYQKSSDCIKVIMEPNDKMLHCFKMAAPSKVSEK